ncbi:MAG: Transcriptional regulator, family [Rhodocyclaceae bacterium]|nr:Transcriptional regulator, family [Rhodocyclaceae bacterium]
MTETSQLIATLKAQLRRQGLTYRDVATALKLSEPSVKRLFASERFTLDRLAQVAHLAGFTLAELAQQAVADVPRLRTLTETQERELVSDTRLLLVAVCALNHWTLADMVAVYRLTEAECLQRLLRLDRLHLIDLLPGNRIRITVARDFDWLPNGPIRQFFRAQGQDDFLNSAFAGPGEEMAFTHGMLTEAAAQEVLTELRNLRRKFALFHDEGLAAPLARRHGTGLLLALREWEPAGFAALRRSHGE